MKSDQRYQKGTKEIGKNHLLELYEHALIGIVECPLDSKYVNVNEEFCRITGHKKAELLRLDVHDLTIPADSERKTDLYQELTTGSLRFYNIEPRYVRKNGAVIWVGIIRSLVRDDGKRKAFRQSWHDDHAGADRSLGREFQHIFNSWTRNKN